MSMNLVRLLDERSRTIETHYLKARLAEHVIRYADKMHLCLEYEAALYGPTAPAPPSRLYDEINNARTRLRRQGRSDSRPSPIAPLSFERTRTAIIDRQRVEILPHMHIIETLRMSLYLHAMLHNVLHPVTPFFELKPKVIHSRKQPRSHIIHDEDESIVTTFIHIPT